MQVKKSTKTFKELPETITPYDYADWRGIGENKAREIFNSKGFPRIQGTGVKQVADKRAVLLFDLGLKDEEKQEVLKELAKEIIWKELMQMKRLKQILCNTAKLITLLSSLVILEIIANSLANLI